MEQVIRGTRTLLLQAGLPHARCYATLHNVAHDECTGSPFAYRHGGNAFTGPLIPFGALVHAVPSALHKKWNLKFEPPVRPAIFLGYVMQDGGKWFGEYLWACVEDLAGKPFCSRSRWRECRVAAYTSLPTPPHPGALPSVLGSRILMRHIMRSGREAWPFGAPPALRRASPGLGRPHEASQGVAEGFVWPRGASQGMGDLAERRRSPASFERPREHHAVQSYEVPRGLLRGRPARPRHEVPRRPL